MLKSLFHWRVLVNLVLAVLVFVGLVWLTFRWLEFHTNHGEEIAVPNVVNMTVQNAVKVLDDAGLDYEIDSPKYDPKFKPYQVLKISPTPGSHVKGGRAISLIVNPKTWAPVVVPDILDKFKGLAFRQLDLVGLKVGDTIYEPSIQRDAIIRMQYNGNTLKPGTQLPRFSMIDLVIGAGPKRNIAVPNVVGLTVAEAKAIIAQNLFEVGLVEFENGSRDETDIVYYQDPEGSSIRDQGMQIDLWASKKTLAELSGKIAELNSIYRMKVDTTAPPPTYDVPAYIPPEPKVVPKEKPKVPATKPEVSVTNAKPEAVKQKVVEQKTTPPTQVKMATASSTKPAETKTTISAPPQDKPKKKIIVE